MKSATSGDLRGYDIYGTPVYAPAGSIRLNVLSVGVPASDAVIQDRSFMSSLNQIATRAKAIIRVVPIREWAEELEEELPH